MEEILGTGLSGLVGSRIVEHLSSKYTFSNLDLTTNINITDYKQVLDNISTSKAKALIHLAAFTDVDKAWEQNGNKNGLCYRVNVTGTRNIAKACRETGKYLIHISTDFVFDGKKTKPYTETDAPNPIEWYGKTKLLAEEEVKKLACRNVILRIAFPFKANPASPDLEPNPKLDLVRKIIKKISGNEMLPMFFDSVITPTYIDDIVKVISRCIIDNPVGIYHCTGSTPVSPYDLASLIAETFNLDKKLIKKTSVRIIENSNLRPRQVYLALSNNKLKKELGVEMSDIPAALQKIKSELNPDLC